MGAHLRLVKPELVVYRYPGQPAAIAEREGRGDLGTVLDGRPIYLGRSVGGRIDWYGTGPEGTTLVEALRLGCVVGMAASDTPALTRAEASGLCADLDLLVAGVAV